MLKRPETIVCGDIGLVLLSGLGSRRTHPVGAEGATMAQRAPFPLSSIPAYIDQSMKLILCASLRGTGVGLPHQRLAHQGSPGTLVTSAYWPCHVVAVLPDFRPQGGYLPVQAYA